MHEFLSRIPQLQGACVVFFHGWAEETKDTAMQLRQIGHIAGSTRMPARPTSPLAEMP